MGADYRDVANGRSKQEAWLSAPYLYGRGAKWSALIGSWCELRARLLEFYDAPGLAFIDAEIARLLQAAVWRKEPGHLINSPYFRQPERGMSAIGG